MRWRFFSWWAIFRSRAVANMTPSLSSSERILNSASSRQLASCGATNFLPGGCVDSVGGCAVSLSSFSSREDGGLPAGCSGKKSLSNSVSSVPYAYLCCLNCRISHWTTGSPLTGCPGFRHSTFTFLSCVDGVILLSHNPDKGSLEFPPRVCIVRGAPHSVCAWDLTMV